MCVCVCVHVCVAGQSHSSHHHHIHTSKHTAHSHASAKGVKTLIQTETHTHTGVKLFLAVVVVFLKSHSATNIFSTNWIQVLVPDRSRESRYYFTVYVCMCLRYYDNGGLRVSAAVASGSAKLHWHPDTTSDLRKVNVDDLCLYFHKFNKESECKSSQR